MQEEAYPKYYRSKMNTTLLVFTAEESTIRITLTNSSVDLVSPESVDVDIYYKDSEYAPIPIADWNRGQRVGNVNYRRYSQAHFAAKYKEIDASTALIFLEKNLAPASVIALVFLDYKNQKLVQESEVINVNIAAPTATCQHCTKQYFQKTTKSRYCSTSCRVMAHKRKHRGVMPAIEPVPDPNAEARYQELEPDQRTELITALDDQIEAAEFPELLPHQVKARDSLKRLSSKMAKTTVDRK